MNVSSTKTERITAAGLHYYLGTVEKGIVNNGHSYAGIPGLLAYLRKNDKTT